MEIIFLLVGFILLIASIWAIIKSISSKKWPTTDGVITASMIHENERTGSSMSSSSTHYRPDIEFTYSVSGKSYKSTKLYFGVKLITIGGYFKSKKLAKKYPVDKQVKVHYNPAKDKEAVLEPGFHNELLMGMFFSILLMVFPVLFIYGFFSTFPVSFLIYIYYDFKT